MAETNTPTKTPPSKPTTRSRKTKTPAKTPRTKKTPAKTPKSKKKPTASESESESRPDPPRFELDVESEPTTEQVPTDQVPTAEVEAITNDPVASPFDNLDAAVDSVFNAMCKVLEKGAKKLLLQAPRTAITSALDNTPMYFSKHGEAALFEKEATHAETEKARGGLGQLEKEGKLAELHPSKTQQERMRKAKKQLNDNAGKMWFDMPATQVTPEIDNTLKLLKMRHVFNPKHFMKADKRKSAPKYFQIGTEIAGPLDHRPSNVKAKQSLVDDLLSDAKFRQYHKKKFSEIQAKNATKARGKWNKSKILAKKAGKNKK